MTLQSSAPISAQDINVELGRSATAAFDINGTEERALAGVASGAISFSDFLGKSSTIPFSITELTASGGTYTFGADSDDRRLLVALAYSSTNGGNVSISAFTLAGHSADTTVASGSTSPAGVRFGLFDISETSGAAVVSSVGSNGNTVSLKVYKILGYNGVHSSGANASAPASQTITTVNGKAAVTAKATGDGSGSVTLIDPTDGGNETVTQLGSGGGAAAGGISFA